MIHHPSLQDTSNPGQVTPDASRLAAVILQGQTPLDEAIHRVAEHLLTLPRVETVATSLVGFTPETEAGWTPLGGRASVSYTHLTLPTICSV